MIDKIGVQMRNFIEIKLAFKQPLLAQPLKEHPQEKRPAGTVLGGSSDRKLKWVNRDLALPIFPPGSIHHYPLFYNVGSTQLHSLLYF